MLVIKKFSKKKIFGEKRCKAKKFKKNIKF